MSQPTTLVAYVASRFERREEMKQVLTKLRTVGIACTSRWITEESDISQAPPEHRDEFRRQWSINDMNDVFAADTFIAFSEDLTHNAVDHVSVISRKNVDSQEWEVFVPAVWARGGRHVEFGMAWAAQKRMVVIGPRENIFHYLPMVEHYESIEDFLGEENRRRGRS